jgi:hypothetical protein
MQIRKKSKRRNPALLKSPPYLRNISSARGERTNAPRFSPCSFSCVCTRWRAFTAVCRASLPAIHPSGVCRLLKHSSSSPYCGCPSVRSRQAAEREFNRVSGMRRISRNAMQVRGNHGLVMFRPFLWMLIPSGTHWVTHSMAQECLAKRFVYVSKRRCL